MRERSDLLNQETVGHLLTFLLLFAMEGALRNRREKTKCGASLCEWKMVGRDDIRSPAVIWFIARLFRRDSKTQMTAHSAVQCIPRSCDHTLLHQVCINDITLIIRILHTTQKIHCVYSLRCLLKHANVTAKREQIITIEVRRWSHEKHCILEHGFCQANHSVNLEQLILLIT